MGGFIFDIIEKRPILVLCNLVAAYYHETEEFGIAGNAIKISSDKRTLKFVTDDFDSAYGTILIDENANYIATWHIKVLFAKWRRYSDLWVGISSKPILNQMCVLPGMYNRQHNVFYAVDRYGNNESRECNGVRVKESENGVCQALQTYVIVKIVLNPSMKQLRVVCRDERTCFNGIKMQYSPFRLAICGGHEGDSLEIIKFEKKY